MRVSHMKSNCKNLKPALPHIGMLGGIISVRILTAPHPTVPGVGTLKTNKPTKRQRHGIHFLRPTSVIRKTDIFFGSMKSLSGSRVGDSRSFLDMIFYHNFYPDRNIKFPKIPPDRCVE